MGDINIRQLVSYGRTPYMKLMRGYDKEDNDAIDWAIDVTGLRDIFGKTCCFAIRRTEAESMDRNVPGTKKSNVVS